MNKRDLARRLREECEVVKRLEHQHYLDGRTIEQFTHALAAIASVEGSTEVLALSMRGVAQHALQVQEVMTPEVTESST